MNKGKKKFIEIEKIYGNFFAGKFFLNNNSINHHIKKIRSYHRMKLIEFIQLIDLYTVHLVNYTTVCCLFVCWKRKSMMTTSGYLRISKCQNIKKKKKKRNGNKTFLLVLGIIYIFIPIESWMDFSIFRFLFYLDYISKDCLVSCHQIWMFIIIVIRIGSSGTRQNQEK